MKLKSIPVFPFLLMVGVLLLAQEMTPKKIVSNLEKRLGEKAYLAFTFVETFEWSLTGESVRLKGKVLLGPGDRFRVTTEDQILVSDGKTFWSYSRPENRLIIDRIGESDELLPRQIFFRYTQDYLPYLEGLLDLEGKKSYLLRLEPREKGAYIPTMRVWVDPKEWIPLRIQQTDLHGNRSDYRIKGMQRFQSVSADSFRFESPKGVDVIDMR